MSDYTSGKIYKIFVEGADEICYIGSTINSLVHRLTEHRYSAQSNAQYKFASTPFFQEGNNVLIELLEAFACNSKQELLAKEAEWLLRFPEAINKNTPILDVETRLLKSRAICLKNYYENREEKMAYATQYKKDNKERIAEQRATPEHRAHQNELVKKRMEDPEYAKAHKAKQSALKTAKVTCQHCQKEMNKNSLSDHIKRLHNPI
jgi:alpha-L-fucosidase